MYIPCAVTFTQSLICSHANNYYYFFSWSDDVLPSFGSVPTPRCSIGSLGNSYILKVEGISWSASSWEIEKQWITPHLFFYFFFLPLSGYASISSSLAPPIGNPSKPGFRRAPALYPSSGTSLNSGTSPTIHSLLFPKSMALWCLSS